MEKPPSSKRRAKSQIPRIVHDLRNPINGILSASECLLEDLSDARDEHVALLEAIHSSSRFMLRLVDDIFHIATSSESVSGQLHLQPTDLVSLVKQDLVLNRKLAERKRVRLDLATGNEAPVLGDPPKLYQVIDRLVTNAIKFSYPDGKIEIRVGVRGARAILSVRDRGIGMPAGKLQTALTGSGSRKTQESDTHALEPVCGLATSRSIVEGHGGRIRLESKLGKGSTFTVILPAARPGSGQRGPA